MNRYKVRLRTTPEWLVWGYSFKEKVWAYRYLDGPLFSSSGKIPDLDADDAQENYWVIETEAGDKYAFQSADVEDVKCA